MVSPDDALSHAKQDAGLLNTQIDLFCERFRELFTRQPDAAIEVVLQEVSSEARQTVLSELIAEEFQLLQVRGVAPSIETYKRRFPGDSAAVDLAFQLAGAPRADGVGRPSINDSQTADFAAATLDTDNEMQVVANDSANESALDEPKQFGPYSVLRPLGTGTFGAVYKAQHESSGHVVAVKMLKSHWAQDPECGEAMRRQFAEEAQMMLQFDHPRVVKVISLDERAEPPYFVQEYIDGDTLHSRLLLSRPTIQEALEYAIQIADGLAHIHSRQRWHRDLKPANILLDRENGVHLADFGLALDDAQRWRSAQAQVGTFPYMSPEQIQGATHRLNARCDLWALGVILYEMLTGKRPFRGENGQQLSDEILERTPTAPRELNQGIPRELNRLCMQCLSKRDADRPHAAADLRDDLRHLLERLQAGEGSSSAYSSTPVTSVAAQPAPQIKPLEHPIPTLRRFTAEQTELYLRLMPKSFSNAEELPELIAYWKQRIGRSEPDDAFTVGVMVGVSGCGKSSLLEAGLVPSLPENITPILVEASEGETELRIISKLRKALPAADTERQWRLSDWAFRLRSGGLLPPGKKVVIILDQFEQWLNAHGGESSNPLLEALHQCDGQHLQAIVCVREGFHATLMRFVQSLSLKLDEDRNYATAHRFSPDHARYVLTQFGRGLKRLDDPLTGLQQAFIDATIDGLAESDRGVVCVRLVVLALVMQDRPWTVEELEQLGGLDGIGCQFLVDCFEGRTASEQYRRYLPAAMRILAELLPAEGLEIKDVRSYDQLLAASELDKLQFDDLLNILVRKLFLLTPVEPVAVSASAVTTSSLSPSSLAATVAEGKTIKDIRSPLGLYYQLTHDFLVPSIREWMRLNEGQTRAGRARLLLAERTNAWRARRERKQLPTLLETVTIRARTEMKHWKSEQRQMMRVAVRHHGITYGALIVVLLIVGVSLQSWMAIADRKGKIQQARVIVDALQNNLGPSIPINIRELRKLPDQLALAELRLRYQHVTDSNQKLALTFALAEYGEADFEYLVSRIDEGLAQTDNANMLQALQSKPQSSTEILIRTADECVDNSAWRRKAKVAATALALGDPSIAIDMCEYNNHPEQRTLFIDEFTSSKLDLERLADLAAESDSSGLRSALCLGIGSRVIVNEQERSAWQDLVTSWFREDGESSTHSAAGWLLRRWGLPEPSNVDASLVRENRDWFVNSLGMTFVRITPHPAQKQEIVLPDPLLKFRADLAASSRMSSTDLANPAQRELRALALFQLGKWEDSLADFEWLLESAPLRSRNISALYVLALTRSNRVQEATREFAKLQSQGLSQTLSQYIRIQLPALTGNGHEAMNQLALALQLDQSKGEYYDLACAAALSSDALAVLDSATSENLKSLAIDCLEKAVSAGYKELDWLVGDPDLVSLHGEVRFMELVRDLNNIGTNLPASEYWIMDREVANSQFRTFLSDSDTNYWDTAKPNLQEYSGSRAQPPDFPAGGISWFDAVMFCNWLSEKEGLSPCYEQTAETLEGHTVWIRIANRGGYRLPTENEWEYACRANSDTEFSIGDNEQLLPSYCQMSSRSAAVVGQKLPNAIGLHDFHGNVWEWCEDLRQQGLHRALRGGSWASTPASCRSAVQYSGLPTNRMYDYGFRPVLSSPLQVLSPSEGDK